MISTCSFMTQDLKLKNINEVKNEIVVQGIESLKDHIIYSEYLYFNVCDYYPVEIKKLGADNYLIRGLDILDYGFVNDAFVVDYCGSILNRIINM